MKKTVNNNYRYLNTLPFKATGWVSWIFVSKELPATFVHYLFPYGQGSYHSATAPIVRHSTHNSAKLVAVIVIITVHFNKPTYRK